MSTTPPSDLFYRKAAPAYAKNALIAIGIAWAIELLYRIVFIIDDVSWSLSYGLDALDNTIPFFVTGMIIRPLFFFVPVFFALWFLLPVTTESSQFRVIVRAAVAGIAGWAGLGIYGLITLFTGTIASGYAIAPSNVADSLLWNSLTNAIGFTVQLVVGATLTWLWLSRTRATPVSPPAP